MPDLDIISRIFEIQFGEKCDPQQTHRLSTPMLDYRTSLMRSGQRTISRAAIEGWLTAGKKAIPSRLPALRFLHGYLGWLDKTGRISPSNKDQLQALEKLLDGYIPAVKPSTNDSPADSQLAFDPSLIKAMRTLVDCSAKAPQKEGADFFWGGDETQPDERSYYVMYRYSTAKRNILKTYIVIAPPPSKDERLFSYRHVVGGGDDPKIGSEYVFRECDGFILKLEKAYYFLGYNYTIKANRRTHPEEYAKKRALARMVPTGMGLIAFEYDDITPSRLTPGLTMTVAAHHQPVISRTALLHLGTKSSFARLESRAIEDMVDPREMLFDQFSDDLKSMIGRLRKGGCQHFSEYLGGLINDPAWDTKGYKALSSELIGLLNNLPLSERTALKKPSGGQGAIERMGTSVRD